MAIRITNYTSKFNYVGKGYLDKKMGPFLNVDDLKTVVASKEITEGMMVVFLNQEGDNVPGIYWFIGGSWQKAQASSADVEKVIADLEDLKAKDAEQDTRINSLIDQIGKISGIDSLKTDSSLEKTASSVEPSAPLDTLGVKVSQAEGNTLEKKEDGLFAGIPMFCEDDALLQAVN